MSDSMVADPVAEIQEARGAAPVAASAGSVGRVAGAAAGLVVLGGAVALGTGSLDVAVHLLPVLVGPTFGALVLTTPALVVAHQFLQVDSPASAVADALGNAVVRVGQIGWGFAPASLVFAATAPGSWPLVLAVDGLLLAAVGLSRGGRDLVALDRRTVWWEVAVLAWGVLTFLVAARLALYALPIAL